jgi:Na+/H+ antiporter NhaD/arsenite permease-like protein
VIFRLIYRKELAKKPENIEQLMKMNEWDAIQDMKTLKRLLVVFVGTITLFFLHGMLHMEPAMVALIGASVALLVVAPTRDPQTVIEKCELSVLLFFGSLFVMVGGLEFSGVLQEAATLLTAGAESNLLLTAIIILWASAIISAIVDNIPLTVAMIPIIGYLGTSGIPVDLLWWALVFGVGFGGNGSPIGSTAGVIVVAKSEKTDNPISFINWLKQGTPVMVGCLLVATAALILFTDHFMGSHGQVAQVAKAEAAPEAHDATSEHAVQHPISSGH